MSEEIYENTDRELYREREGDFYADSIHVTQSGGIGINCGGTVYVKRLRAWHDLAAQQTCGCEKLRDFIKAYFMYGVRRFPDGRNYRDHAKELLAQPCSCQQAPILGPTGEHKCPKCGNSFQNAIPDGSPDWLRCATCKHVWWQTPASAGSEEWHIEKGGGLVMDRGHTIQYMASAMAISIADAHNAALRRISAPTVEAWRDLDDKEEPRDDDRFITVWQTDGDGRACRQRRVSAPQSSDKTASVGRQTNE